MEHRDYKDWKYENSVGNHDPARGMMQAKVCIFIVNLVRNAVGFKFPLTSNIPQCVLFQ